MESFIGTAGAALAIYILSIPFFKAAVFGASTAGGSILLTGFALYVFRPSVKKFDYKKSHFVFMCGKSKKTKEKIVKIAKDNDFVVTSESDTATHLRHIELNTKCSVVGFTQEMHKYVKSSDVFISIKPGPGTISEAIYLDIPLILDSSDTLPWEKLNLQLAKQQRLGKTVATVKEYLPTISKAVKEAPEMKANIKKFKQTQTHDFSINIQKAAYSLLKITP